MNLNHWTSLRILLAGAFATLAAGCADDTTKATTASHDATADASAGDSSPTPDSQSDAGPDVPSADAQPADAAGDATVDAADTSDAGAGDVADAEVADAGGPSEPKRLAVLGSDFTSSALSLIDLTTGQVTSNVVNSGTVVSATGTALSGDVVLAQTPTLDGRIVLVDRKNGVLTWLDPVTLKVTGQLNVGFANANIQDYVQVSATKAYVTRAAANVKPTAAADDFDDGDDVAVLDLAQQKIVGRIDLAGHATLKGVVAFGGRMAFDGKTVWVPLANLAADFATAGPGRVVAIDSATDKVVHDVDAPDVKNCTKAVYLPASKTVAVVCQGFFGDGPEQLKASGVLAIDASAATPTAKVAITAISLGGKSPLFKGPLNGNIGFVDGARGLVVTAGDSAAKSPDRVWLIDLVAGTGEPIAQGGGAFSLNGTWGDTKTKKVYVGEAFHVGGDLRVFDLAGPATVTELPSLTSNPGGVGAQDLGGF